jgi:hypothetical protein
MAVWVAAGEKLTCPLFMSLAENKASPPLAVPDGGQAAASTEVFVTRRARRRRPAEQPAWRAAQQGMPAPPQDPSVAGE